MGEGGREEVLAYCCLLHRQANEGCLLAGTFGLKDEIGSVALSAKVLYERKGPFLLVDFDCK